MLFHNHEESPWTAFQSSLRYCQFYYLRLVNCSWKSGLVPGACQGGSRRYFIHISTGIQFPVTVFCSLWLFYRFIFFRAYPWSFFSPCLFQAIWLRSPFFPVFSFMNPLPRKKFWGYALLYPDWYSSFYSVWVTAVVHTIAMKRNLFFTLHDDVGVGNPSQIRTNRNRDISKIILGDRLVLFLCPYEFSTIVW